MGGKGGWEGGREEGSLEPFDHLISDHSTLVGLYMCIPKSNEGFHIMGHLGEFGILCCGCRKYISSKNYSILWLAKLSRWHISGST